jgi:hypothetical protein
LEQTEPQAYEIRLIDDDEDYYIPFYEVSALEANGAIGKFDSLALVENKKYQPPQMAKVGDLASLASSGLKASKNIFTVHIKLPFLESCVDIDMDLYEHDPP